MGTANMSMSDEQMARMNELQAQEESGMINDADRRELQNLRDTMHTGDE